MPDDGYFLPEAIADITPTARPLADIGAYECRWPVGPLEADPVLFCRAREASGRPYCPAHWRLSRRRHVETADTLAA